MTIAQALGLAPMRDSSPAQCSPARTLPPSDSADPLPLASDLTWAWGLADPAPPTASPTPGCAPEGMAYRGVFFGLLLALPFWLIVIALVVVLL